MKSGPGAGPDWLLPGLLLSGFCGISYEAAGEAPPDTESMPRGVLEGP